MINLGDKVKDTVTNYTGIVVGISYYLQGCRQIGVKSQELKDGKPMNAIWFDEPQLKIVKKGVVKPLNTEEPLPEAKPKKIAKRKLTGGPMLETPPLK